MSEWKEIAIGELGRVITGKTPSSKQPEHFGELIPFVTPTDFSNYNKNIFGAERYLSKEGLNALKSKELPSNSLLVTCIGSQMGKVAINRLPVVTNQQINAIIPATSFVPDYLYYKLSSMQDFLRNLATGGSTMPIVNKADFERIKVELPDFKTQQEIAEILSALDDKIELNNQINANLEALAQAIFKQWFIDFEFPDENGNPYKSSGGKMVESELGEIPMYWQEKSLDNIADYLNGLALQKFPAEDENDFIPVIKIRELKQGITSSSDRASRKVPSAYIVKDGDVLFSWSGTLVVDFWCHGEGALNQHLFKVTSKEFPKWFYFLWTQYHLNSFIQIASSKATTMGHIQRHHLADAKVFVPPQSQIRAFNEILEPIIGQIINSRTESHQLIYLRNLILPKLVTGELEVLS